VRDGPRTVEAPALVLRTLGASAVAFVLLAAACSSNNSGASGRGPGVSCPRDGTVLAALRDVERSGEGLVSATFGEYRPPSVVTLGSDAGIPTPSRTPDWQRAATVFSLLTKAWNDTKTACPDLPSALEKAMDTAIQALKTAIAAKDQKTAANAANGVGIVVPPLFDYFHPDIPLEIVRLDATFRQVGIDAHFGDWTAVQADVTSIATDWGNSRAAVQKRAPTCHRVGATDTVVGDIDQSLGNLQTAEAANDRTMAEQESENGATEIDTLELLFDCPSDGPAPKTGLGAACKAAADCTVGEVCDAANKGGTCAPDPANANIGAPCSATTDCGSDSRSACNTEAGDSFPGGYCGMEPCDDVHVCPAGATCVSQPHETPGCWKSCTTDADCRTKEGYACQLFPINATPTSTLPAGFGPSAMACGFPCTNDGGCTSPLTCNVATGRCKP
jgi:hypothetical protein